AGRAPCRRSDGPGAAQCPSRRGAGDRGYLSLADLPCALADSQRIRLHGTAGGCRGKLRRHPNAVRLAYARRGVEPPGAGRGEARLSRDRSFGGAASKLEAGRVMYQFWLGTWAVEPPIVPSDLAAEPLAREGL